MQELVLVQPPVTLMLRVSQCPQQNVRWWWRRGLTCRAAMMSHAIHSAGSSWMPALTRNRCIRSMSQVWSSRPVMKTFRWLLSFWRGWRRRSHALLTNCSTSSMVAFTPGADATRPASQRNVSDGLGCSADESVGLAEGECDSEDGGASKAPWPARDFHRPRERD